MNDLAIIPLKSRTYPGHHAIIDSRDADRVLRYHWILRKSDRTFYAFARVSRDGKIARLHLHKLVYGARDDVLVDHENGDGLDCRRSNLRQATQLQNSRNRKNTPTERSPYKGVHLPKGMKRWQAYIYIEYKRTHLGYFDTAEEAAHAYDDAARRHFGEFARPNFPQQ